MRRSLRLQPPAVLSSWVIFARVIVMAGAVKGLSICFCRCAIPVTHARSAAVMGVAVGEGELVGCLVTAADGTLCPAHPLASRASTTATVMLDPRRVGAARIARP